MNKLSDLHVYIKDLGISLLGIVETWCTSDYPDAMICPPGYSCARKDRVASPGGGVCIMFSDLLSVFNVILPVVFNNLEVVAIDVLHCNVSTCRFVVAYIPPQLAISALYIQGFIDCLVWLSRVAFPVIVCGDFNRPNLTWSPEGVALGGSQLDSFFSDAFVFAGFDQFVLHPSRGNNFLSLLFCNRPAFVQQVFMSYPFCNSDSPPHLPILFTIPTLQTHNPSRRFLAFGKADYRVIINIIESVLAGLTVPNLDNVGQCHATGAFQCCMKSCLNVIPVLARRQYSSPFVRTCARIKLSAWKILRESPTLLNKCIYDEISRAYRDNVVFERSHSLRAICDRGDRTAFFRFAKAKFGGSFSIPALTNGDGVLFTTDKDKADVLVSTFAGSYLSSDPQVACSMYSQDIEVNAGDNSIASTIFSHTAIKRVIHDLKSSAPGPDGLPAIFFKKAGPRMVDLLYMLFHECLSVGRVPEVWRHAIVVPIYKGSGSLSDPSRYRPISLTCIPSKIMERCILAFVLPLLETYGVIPKEQFGSIAKRSPLVQLLSCFHRWAKSDDANVPFDIMFIDFAKAFDRVCRPLLFKLLLDIGLPPILVRLISYLFSSRTHSVRVGGVFSKIMGVDSGVVQGTVLGPILFVIFTCRVPAVLRPIQCAMFVDDVKWFAQVLNLSEGFALQSGCDRMADWCSVNQLALAADKCCVMHVGGNNVQFSYNIGGVVLPSVDIQHDLGILIRSDLSFSAHCASVASSAMRLVHVLRRGFAGCDVGTLSLAFTVYILPTLEYCSPLWSPSKVVDIRVLERPLRLFSRYLPGMRGLDYRARLSVLGLRSLEWRRLIADLILCYKLIYGLVYFDPSYPILCLSTNRSRGHSLSVTVPFARKNCFYGSFGCRVARAWNALPQDLVISPSVSVFKRGIASLDLSGSLKCYPF